MQPSTEVSLRAALIATSALFLHACATGPSELRHFVDLSHPFDADTIYWPTEDGFVLERGSAGVTAGGYYYEAHRFRSAEHGGTHIDAPIHFHGKGWTVDEIPLDRLMGEGVRIDVSAACRDDRDHRIDVPDLTEWEERHGRIPLGSIVLIDTEFAQFWPDRARYLGTAERGVEATQKLHFPGLHPDAARWLISERKIRAVGLDTASIDHGPSRSFESHRILSASNVPVFENLANLSAIPPRGFRVVALPMKIRGGSGGPLRILAEFKAR